MPVCREADVLRMVQDSDRHGLAGNDARQRRPATTRAPHGVALETFGATVTAGHAGVVEHRHARRMPGGIREDRKSTRLNSSHLVISYAVFCLKKKDFRAKTHEQSTTRSRLD